MFHARRIAMRSEEIVRIGLTRNDMLEIWHDAKSACVGGKSQVRNGGDRDQNLLIDQIVGLAGNFALAIWRDGDARAYRDSRHYQNKFPEKGDGGFDLPRCKIDVKTSMMRGHSDPMRYHLIVRPAERHPEWLYALALSPQFEVADLKDGLEIMLVGWAVEKSIPKEVDKEFFEGAHILKADMLNPFVPLSYGI